MQTKQYVCTFIQDSKHEKEKRQTDRQTVEE